MNCKSMLLYASLMLLPNISAEKEKEYWEKGIITFDDLYSSMNQQLSFFSNSISDEIDSIFSQDCVDANRIANILDKKTGKKDFYRIAYSIPDDVVFIDIETTGLSHTYHYVTMIGWIRGGKYDYWLVGTDPTKLIKTINSAKLIVTFNGKRFDTKFIDLLFPDLKVNEKPHLDLCPFCRRFGLEKGQKAIEVQLGYNRPDSIHDCNGKEAVILWYKFLFGNDDALDSLILYNYYDVLGMTYIIDELFFNRIYGKMFPLVGKPKPFYSERCIHNIHISASVCKKIRKQINSNVFDFKLLSSSNNACIVGIDLAGVIKKTSRTGLCVLCNNTATTKVAIYDSEIEAFIAEHKPDIISIDAPLSLPNGRTSVYDDDITRESAGISRYCERELWRRGVKAYPALIKSMQELTKRGIMLSQKLRKMGYPVIECFPGAAQDILLLPRKKDDPDLLKTGLSRLGIHGDFEDNKVVHDELDAITAAIVAKFFIDSYYEPIGIDEENDMIVPCVQKRIENYKLVIGITGHIAAGKTTVSEYLQKKGFSYCRYSQIIAERLEAENTCVNRESLQAAGVDIFSSNSQYNLNRFVDLKVEGNPLVVIDGMRHFEDYTYWKERCFSNFHLVYIDASHDVCEKRYHHGNYDQCMSHPVEQEVDSLRGLADVVIDNNGSFKSLYAAIDRLLSKHKQY